MLRRLPPPAWPAVALPGEMDARPQIAVAAANARIRNLFMDALCWMSSAARRPAEGVPVQTLAMSTIA